MNALSLGQLSRLWLRLPTINRRGFSRDKSGVQDPEFYFPMNVYDDSTTTPQMSTNSVRFGSRLVSHSFRTICNDIVRHDFCYTYTAIVATVMTVWYRLTTVLNMFKTDVAFPDLCRSAAITHGSFRVMAMPSRTCHGCITVYHDFLNRGRSEWKIVTVWPRL